MKKIAFKALTFVMTIILATGILATAAVASQIGVLSYKVSTTVVNIASDNTGSFTITVPKPAEDYGGVEYILQLPSGVSIGSLQFNQPSGGLSLPLKETSTPGEFLFSRTSISNQYKSDMVCTVVINYTGKTETALTIKSVTQIINRATGDRLPDTLISDPSDMTSITIVPNGAPLPANALLSSLSLSAGTLSPSFDPNITAYSASVPNSVSSITVTARAATPGATVSGAGAPIPLAVGYNRLEVTVTAPDSSAKLTYVLNITRNASGDIVDNNSSGSPGGTPGGPGGPAGAGAGGNIDTPASGGQDVADTGVDIGGDAGNPGASADVKPFPFTDVGLDDWFYGDVYYMWANGLMKGTSDTLFSPDSTLTRGMAVTVLYRIEGSPGTASLPNPFEDVPAGEYYADPIKWAVDQDIVVGYGGGLFGPDDYITREQMAAILYRYEHAVDKAPPSTGASIAFADEPKISDYAKEPVSAMVAQSVIFGKPNNMFDPAGNATRAEFAAVLHRFLNNVQ